MADGHRVSLTTRQIILMNFGFFGVQYSAGMQQTAVNPIFSFLHATANELPLLNIAGPMTGLIIQPLIGAMSDRTWSPRWGRRKPYFLVGAVGCSVCLLVFPFCTTLWLAVLMLWLLDMSNNTATEPYRAFIADTLPEAQHAQGFLTQSFFTGFGITLANVSLFVFQRLIGGQTAAGIPYWVFGSFFVGAVCSIGSVLVSVATTPEVPPDDAELERLRTRTTNVFGALAEIGAAIRDMPRTLWQLAVVFLFQWYAMFCFWQYISLSIAKSVWHATPGEADAYSQAVAWTGLVNGSYNVVTVLCAFAMMWAVRKSSPKLVHAGALLLAAMALFALPLIGNKYLLFLPMIGFGVGWASMVGVPYIMVADAVPAARSGVYMGVMNMMIVIPMLLETLTFGLVYDRLLHTDPENAMMFAGGLMLCAAVATLMIGQARAKVAGGAPATAPTGAG